MAPVGHVLIGDEGTIVGMDAAFCTLMHADAGALDGLQVLDLTAPADRTECADALRALRMRGTPFSITKRFIRPDGSLVWVTNSVSITTGSDQRATIVATIEPATKPIGHGPAVLLDKARRLIAARADRATICDTSLSSDPAWDAILAAYVAEAEGTSIGYREFAAVLGIAQPAAARWIKALVQHEVLQIELRDPSADAPKAFTLTNDTHAKLEAYLATVRM